MQAVAKNGRGNARALTDFERLRADSKAWAGTVVDDEWVWYLDGADPTAVRRVHKDGGAPESLASGASRHILAVTTDRCNVYWVSGSSPRQVFGRSK